MFGRRMTSDRDLANVSSFPEKLCDFWLRETMRFQ
jgi:hypothetical protein